MDEITPLLCSHSPRDIKEVAVALQQCPFDIVYAKYMPIGEAYKHLRNYFLEHIEYTHYVACPDDLMITKEKLLKLIEEIDKGQYQVLTGCCNVDLDEYKDVLNFTNNLPHPTRMIPGKQIGWRAYNWTHASAIDDGIIQVPFAGMACAIISRDVIERVPFRDDREYNKGEPNGMFGSVDVVWNNDLMKAGIPMRVHTGVRFTHLRHGGPVEITIGNGFLKFIRAS